MVDTSRVEEDGDLHLDIRLDSAYRKLLRAGNSGQQHGDLVVEFMPRDHGHLPQPSAGDRVVLIGAWVDDAQHDWNELHPVWAVRIDGGAWHRSGPKYGGSPADARSRDAIATCRTGSGRPCVGYGGATAGSTSSGGSSTTHHAPSHTSGNSSGRCDPNYAGACLDPNASDYDCSGGSGNGPKYVQGPVRVVGEDHYQLDANGDGIGCN